MSTVTAGDVEANRVRQRSYESVYQSADDPWDYFSCADRIRFERIAATARRWSSQPERALDVACGLGQLTVRLAEFSREVWAYDFAPSAVQRTRERCRQAGHERTRVEVRDALDPGYASGSFDLILMCDMATDGNTAWWCQVLEKHKELLGSGGTMVVAGRVKARRRPEFERTFADRGGVIVDRILFHDRYWYKARSAIKRVLPAACSRSLLGQDWFFNGAAAMGKLRGPQGSIHYGVVVRFP
ncbi:MAG: class I SAM-dependent methyltransferase [Planctomycetia bacterium]|jgi:SAM-dependent methyltransferase